MYRKCFKRKRSVLQERSQSLKEVPQHFTDVFNIDGVTANDIIQRNHYRKEKKNELEFHSSHWC